MIHALLPLLILPAVTCNPLQLNLLSTANTSSIVSGELPAPNVTRLTTYNTCYDHTEGHVFTTTKSDCERALDKLVNGKSLIEPHSFGYQKSRITDRLPVEAEFGSCNIALLTFDLDIRISMTYAEIYAELLGPNGVLKDCLGEDVPITDALGGQTALGPGNNLVVEVTGQPKKAIDQKGR